MAFTPCEVKTTMTSKYAVLHAHRKLTAAYEQQAGSSTSKPATNGPINLFNDSVSESHRAFTLFALLNNHTTQTSILNPPTMPGFTSFYLKGHMSNNAAPQTDFAYDSEPEFETLASKKHHLQLQQRHTHQMTHIYGTVMTRSDTHQTLTMLKGVKSHIDAQVEEFHEMGLMSLGKRKESIQRFVKKSQDVYRDGSRAVQKFRSAQAPVGEVAEGLGLLVKHKVGKNGEEEMWDVGCGMWSVLW